MRNFISLVFILFSVQAQAVAFPETGKTRFYIPFGIEAPDQNVTYDFEGIVALSNCSGSIVRFDDSADTDSAMVLTNGHCVEFLDPGEVRVREPASRGFRVLGPNAEALGTITAKQLLYATMTKTDMAIYVLQKTYAQILAEFNVRPLTLSRSYVVPQSEIEVISGYWKRGFSCKADGFVFKLKESAWEWSDSIRYSRPGCEVFGGTSGSPVVAKNDRTVVGVNNTINENGQSCTMNNPCEVNEAGEVSFTEGVGYAQQTSWVYSCLDKERQLNLNREGCLLPRPAF
jgi:V8-like Glu-specific endopeptidase